MGANKRGLSVAEICREHIADSPEQLNLLHSFRRQNANFSAGPLP